MSKFPENIEELKEFLLGGGIQAWLELASRVDSRELYGDDGIPVDVAERCMGGDPSPHRLITSKTPDDERQHIWALSDRWWRRALARWKLEMAAVMMNEASQMMITMLDQLRNRQQDD